MSPQSRDKSTEQLVGGLSSASMKLSGEIVLAVGDEDVKLWIWLTGKGH